MKIELDIENANRVKQLILERELRFKKGIKLVFWRALTLLESSIMSNIRRNFRTGTGHLMNSVPDSKDVFEKDGWIWGQIGSTGVKYSAIHEFGGDIYPSKKFLAIPMDAVKGADGVARAKPMDFYGKSFFYTSKKGDLFLAIANSERGITPLFLMKRKVTIPPRPYIRPALDKNRERIFQKFGLFLEETWSIKE